jgi:hypothetical protein
MASSHGVVFPATMANYLSIPVDICCSSMLAESTPLSACLVIENTAATYFQ